ncbi:MAG TPA: cysteine synthase [Actinomycetota bacterium]|nr:cysteine synthase [Actinomycetota bacterium]
MRIDDISGLVGNTPLVGISRLSPNPRVRMWAKLEGQNPTGSVKDRIAQAMLDAAEASGELTPERRLLEPTSGNTGISLAFLARRRGYPLMCVMPETASAERRDLIKAYGAQIKLTEGEYGSNGAIRVAEQMVEEDPTYLMLYQYGNEANPGAHYATTGPEILNDLPEVTHFVAGLGTGGTLTGVGRYLKENKPEVQIVAAEPQQGDLVYGLRSLADGFVPPVFDPTVLDRRIKVSATDSVRLTKEVLAKEGIFCGISAGATVHVARRVAMGLDAGDIVCLFADGGWKYLSTAIWTKETEQAASDVEYMPW